MSDKKCPNCGACKECGAPRPPVYPNYWPPYYVPYTRPYPGGAYPYTTCGSSGTAASGGISGNSYICQMTTVLLVVIAMLVFKSIMEEQTRPLYRCTKCGASKPDMHSKWCLDRKKNGS